MVSSINGNNDDSIQALMMQMMQNMSAADTDGTKGLSLEELSSIDTQNDVGGAAFLNSLKEQFESLDADGNGQLSSDEISQARPPEPMGPPPGMNLEKSDDLFDNLIDALSESLDSDESNGVSSSELASANTKSSDFIENIINNFDSYDTNSDGELSQDEMKNAMKEQTSGTESTTAKASNDSKLEELGESLGNMASVFLQRMINSYKDGGLSSLTSSLNISG